VIEQFWQSIRYRPMVTDGSNAANSGDLRLPLNSTLLYHPLADWLQEVSTFSSRVVPALFLN
jgi:hypothetical protein